MGTQELLKSGGLFCLAVFAITWVLVGLYVRFASHWGVVDIPNARSSHTQITVRGGGLVIVAAWAISTSIFAWTHSDFWLLTTILPSALLTAAIGWWDDLKSVPARYRFAVHLISALWLVFSLGGVDTLYLNGQAWQLGVFGSLLAVFAIVWSLNLFNFMDGTDGIASVETLTVVGVGGYILFKEGELNLAINAWLLCAATSGFLFWNWPKAKVFMGDVCSGFLGLAIGAFALFGNLHSKVSVVVWVILYTVFWLDASVTLMRRIARGEQWLSAHRSHAYQRLHHIAGWSHFKILMGVCLLNVGLALIALWTQGNQEFGCYGVIAAILLVGTAYLGVEKIAPMPPRTSNDKGLIR